MIEILAALAVARVSVFIVRERAPFGVMEKIREFIGADGRLPTYEKMLTAKDEDYEIGIRQKHLIESKPRFYELAYLLSCVWCVSIWIALIACLLLDFPLWYALPFSAVAIIYDEKIS